jgi:hypothetical protein
MRRSAGWEIAGHSAPLVLSLPTSRIPPLFPLCFFEAVFKSVRIERTPAVYQMLSQGSQVGLLS